MHSSPVHSPPVPSPLARLLRRARLPGLAALLLALAFGALAPASASAQETAALELRQAQWRANPGDAPEAVTLPDTWGGRLGRSSGRGEYRLHFDLPEQPSSLWALRIARVSPTRQVWLNGQPVDDEPSGGRRSPLPALIDLPPQMLRAGPNELVLAVDYNVRGGLSAVEVGPASLLHRAHENGLFWERELPRTANLSSGAIALTMLLVWWRRRRETALGLFGLLGLVGALRNYSYFSDLGWVPPIAIDRFYFCAQVWTGLLLYAYARQLNPAPLDPAAQRRGRLAFRLLLAAPLLMAFAAPGPTLAPLRLVIYPLVIGMAVLAVRHVARAARRAGGRVHWVLVASLAACVAAGVHDYLFQQGWLPITHSFALAAVMPVTLSVNALILLDRMTASLDEVERFSHQLEQRVAERTQELRVANAAKSRFIAAASHDLRQPAAALGLLLDLAAAEPAPPPLGNLLQRARGAAAALGALLDRLLDLSRLDAPGAPPSATPVALQPLFDRIALDAAAQAGGLRLRFRPSTAWVLSDAALLEQILRNLVGNALRYTERGGVLVAARRHGRGQLRLQVWDTGCGIAPEHQALVFEEFTRLPASGAARSQGLGLGLAIVDRAARQLGHARGLRSTPGRGSCFWVDLPQAAPGPAAPAPALARPANAGLPGDTIVWLVENDDTLREALASALVAQGARVCALAGRGALEAHLADTQDWPHAVVCDWRLADGEGPDCVALVRAQSPLPVAAVVITGNTAPADLARQAASGLSVLHKPFATGQLLDELAAQLAEPAHGG
jgi:signal transduction histidine kinase